MTHPGTSASKSKVLSPASADKVHSCDVMSDEDAGLEGEHAAKHAHATNPHSRFTSERERGLTNDPGFEWVQYQDRDFGLVGDDLLFIRCSQNTHQTFLVEVHDAD